MDRNVERLAREAALELEEDFGADFPLAVESQLVPGGATGAFGTVEWASLLVAAASLAWSIYRDLSDRARVRAELEQRLEGQAKEMGVPQEKLTLIIVALVNSLPPP